MDFQEYITSIIEALSVNKIRTALAMLGIVIGIAAVITLVALGEASQNQVEERIQALGTNNVTVNSANQTPSLTLDDASALKELPGVKDVSPQVTGQVDISYSKNSTQSRILGVTSAYLTLHELTLDQGVFFSDFDNESIANVAVIGPDIVTDLFPGEIDIIGKTIRVNNQLLVIIGVTKSQGGSVFFNQDNLVFVPLKTAQFKLLGSKNLSAIEVGAIEQEYVSTLKSEIEYLLLQRHNFENIDEADFQIQSLEQLLETASAVTESFTSLLTGIAAISLLVGGIGIMNVMLVNVIERTREIGLRKALGATKKSIVLQFLGESIALTAIGGIIGVGVGAFATFSISQFTDLGFVFPLSSVLISLTVSSVVGILFGAYPASRASKLAPVDALGYE